MLDKAEAMLKFPLAKTIRENRDGKEIITVTPARWNLNTAVNLAESGLKIQLEAIRNEDSRGETDAREEEFIIMDYE